jgi:hypothetical protein
MRTVMTSLSGVKFDDLTRSLPLDGSRRRLLIALLGGVLGILGLERQESSGKNARKKCKKKKGKEKKKCLKKAKTRGTPCRVDGDCPDRIESCQGGFCRPVCPLGACPGCGSCVVRFAADGDRLQQCAGEIQSTIPALACNADANCLAGAPVCISTENESCTRPPCGTCVVFVGPCL